VYSNRHHRPVFGAHEVGDADVYQSTTSVSTSYRSAAVPRQGQAVATSCWFGELATSGASLAARYGRYPHVVNGRSPARPAHARVRAASIVGDRRWLLGPVPDGWVEPIAAGFVSPRATQQLVSSGAC